MLFRSRAILFLKNPWEDELVSVLSDLYLDARNCFFLSESVAHTE